MKTLQSLEELRKLGEKVKGSCFTGVHCDAVLSLADEIESEIAERFMELPVGADGVPWTLETESFVDDTGREVEFSGLQVDREGRWKILSICVWHDPSLCRHAKSDPLKELLNDRINDVLRVMTSGIGIALETALNDSFGEECADEIRELMKEGGE